VGKKKGTSESPSSNASPRLTAPRTEAERQIVSQIEEGKRLQRRRVETEDDFEELRAESEEWDDFNILMLRKLFDSPEVSKGYGLTYGDSMIGMILPFREEFPYLVAHTKLLTKYLESVKKRLPLYQELTSAPTSKKTRAAAEQFDKAMDRSPVPFISMSFDSADEDINDYVKGILDALRIPYVTGERWSKESIPEKVRTRILESDFVISVFVKRGTLKNGGHTTPSWLVREATIAQEAGKSVVALAEKGITDLAGLNLEKELIYFERDDVKAIQNATIKFLEALKEHAPACLPGEAVSTLESLRGKDLRTTESVRKQVVRDERGDLYYVDNGLSRHQMPDDATAQYFAGPRGALPVSTEQLERYPLTEPITTESVQHCEILYLEPGPHIYVLLSGRTKYVGIPDLTRWGRQQPEHWRHVDEEEFRSYPSWE
jgi:hypothetical protein